MDGKKMFDDFLKGVNLHEAITQNIGELRERIPITNDEDLDSIIRLADWISKDANKLKNTISYKD